MDFLVNAAERVRITSAGRVGIGETSPDTTFHVNGGTTVAKFERDSGTNGSLTISFPSTRATFDASGDLSIKNGGTERVRFHSGGVISATQGIALGVGTANTASNVLDDYEEGTFTPQVKISGDTAGIQYDTQIGLYTKIGRVVTININIALTNKGSNTGNVSIIGLPFTSVSNSVGVGAVSGYKIANTGHMWMRLNENGTTTSFNNMNSSGTAAVMTGGAFSNDSEFQITGTYLST
tara:strand:- start:44 stop:754 length:711 start_codon:yes stop_codon:yes gene_type:complete